MNLWTQLRLLLRGGYTEVRALVRGHPMVAVCLAFVLLTGVVATHAYGVGWVRAAYETVRLFFDSADMSFAEGASPPDWAVALVWVDRFLAPAVVAGAVLEVVHRVSRHGTVRPWWRDHVVIVGAGALGTALARHLARGGRRVVMVELDHDNPNLEGLRCEGVTIVEGDGRQRETLARARVDRAREICALTGDDIANFAALLHAARIAGRRRLRAKALVADADLRERLAPPIEERFGRGNVLINAFDVAAEDLVSRNHVLGHGPTTFVVAGYGKFGAAVADAAVARHGDREDLHVWLVDPQLTELTPALAAWEAEHPGHLHREPHDMLDRTMWARLLASLAPQAKVDFAICTDNDAKNVAFALAMRGHAHAHCATLNIVIRMLDWSKAEADTLPGVHVVSMKDLVIDGLGM